MTKEEVWNIIMNLKIGTVVSWIIVIAAIITGLVLLIKKLFKGFRFVQNYKTEKHQHAERIQRHDLILDDIVARLERLDTRQERLNRALIQSIRHDIVLTCQSAIAEGQISAVQLRELDELYEEYDGAGGNSYASTLMQKVHGLPIIG